MEKGHGTRGFGNVCMSWYWHVLVTMRDLHHVFISVSNLDPRIIDFKYSKLRSTSYLLDQYINVRQYNMEHKTQQVIWSGGLFLAT